MSSSIIMKYDPPGNAQRRMNVKAAVKRFFKRAIYVLYPPAGYALVAIHRKPEQEKRYGVSICAIFRDEAQFLKEWIDYHTLIGVEHFYLYNNFSEDNYAEVLAPYIDRGMVTLTQWPYRFAQVAAYQDCIDRHTADARWIGFIDIDEFVCLKTTDSLPQWLAGYEKYPSVILCWRMFGTSGLAVHDPSKPVIEQYTACWTQLTDIGKSMINTSFRFKKAGSPHFFYGIVRVSGVDFPVPGVNEYRRFVLFHRHHLPRRPAQPTAQINHYWSKALDLYDFKINSRGDSVSQRNAVIRKTEGRFEYHEQKNTSTDPHIGKFVERVKRM